MARVCFVPILGALALALGCQGGAGTPALTKPAEEEIPKVQAPPENGPKLGAIANLTPVMDRPGKGAKQLGYLHAGAKLARSAEPYSKKACEGGWYPVRPRGFVCAGSTATLDLAHPTLAAMALQPKLDQELPYAYARVARETPLFARDEKREDAVREDGKLRRRSGMAVVGSWSATDPEGRAQRFALMPNGRFVRASDLQAAEISTFSGIEIDKEISLPVAFVVKRGVRAWKLDGLEAEKADLLEYHDKLQLTGRFRTVNKVRYWLLKDGRWVRHPDVSVVQRRNAFPDFVVDGKKWMDVSIVAGTLVAYEGKRPILVTLVSAGRDRFGDPKTTASTALGTFDVVGKHVTAAALDPRSVDELAEIYDVPWALELSSGQFLHGAFWHDRFGIEHGQGNIQLSPKDAARLWQWATPELPPGWHAVTQAPSEAERTVVLVRK
jgi:hypothetical protein